MSEEMKVYTCNNFEGHWPVGTAAVIVAMGEHHAKELLRAKLDAVGLGYRKGAFTVVELPTVESGARILCDGNY